MELDYGVCRLSVVPVREKPSHRAEQVTQLLFGDHYEVREVHSDGKWIKVSIHFDRYEGWVDVRQHHQVSKEYFDYVNRAEFKITTDLVSTILYNKNPQMVLMGSIIPISSSELFRMEEKFAFNGESKNLGQKRDAAFIENIARRYLYSPYQWGGKSPFGIDCSGFVQMVYRISGYTLLRDASQQAHMGKEVKTLDASKPGDLAFFGEGGKVVHTGILLGKGAIIHASGQVRIDKITEDGIISEESKALTHTLAHIRRIIPD